MELKEVTRLERTSLGGARIRVVKSPSATLRVALSRLTRGLSRRSVRRKLRKIDSRRMGRAKMMIEEDQAEAESVAGR
jgi:hypothetical protein